MFCPNCGKENQDGVVRCEYCSQPMPAPKVSEPVQQQPQSQEPPTWQQETQQQPPQQPTGQQAPPQQPYGQQPVYGQPQQPYGQQPGAGGPGYIPPAPKDYLVGNIIFTILGCCSIASPINIILGIIGIVFSAQTRSKFKAGDFAGADQASKVAKILFIVNLILVIVGVVAGVFYGIYLFSSGIFDYYYYNYFSLFLP